MAPIPFAARSNAITRNVTTGEYQGRCATPAPMS
jgi:hypothetical protein